MSNPNATTELAHYWRAQLIEELTALPLQFSSVRVVESHIQFCTGTRVIRHPPESATHRKKIYFPPFSGGWRPFSPRRPATHGIPAGGGSVGWRVTGPATQGKMIYSTLPFNLTPVRSLSCCASQLADALSKSQRRPPRLQAFPAHLSANRARSRNKRKVCFNAHEGFARLAIPAGASSMCH